MYKIICIVVFTHNEALLNEIHGVILNS